MVISPNNEKKIIFDLKHKGTIVGTLEATRQTNGDTEKFTINTEITKKVLHIKHCEYDLVINYENGELQSSDYKLYVNNKLDKSTTINKIGDRLSGSKNNKSKKIKEKSINFSSALLYFKEPIGVSETFSEPKLKSRSLRPHESKAHTYVLGKNSGEYYYENGELQRMVYDDMVTIELVRRE